MPTAIYANNYYEGAGSDPDGANCERCWLTVQPLAQRLHLTVAFDRGYPAALGGNQGAADAIKRAGQNHSVVLAAWEHVNIQFLTEDLGVPKSQIPYWSGEVWHLGSYSHALTMYSLPTTFVLSILTNVQDYDTIYVLNLTASGALASFEVQAQSYTPQSTTCPPHFVPPGSSPTLPSPVPAGMQWECHAQHTSTDALRLRDDDLRYVGSSIGACQNECNARRGCTAIVWFAADERCRVLSGATTHGDYLASLEADPGRSTCVLVEEHRASPPARADLVEAGERRV